ncbi:uncharacterized protein LOC121738351 [Aricia agestis]|uniref:uncharacterized protein LOC121738351 n=1 Tax=Aricia agestis TaxID=91739 RepID=UPI001C20B732|nr:uncharacterized protein LOC121738351 [Aricia agestis]
MEVLLLLLFTSLVYLTEAYTVPPATLEAIYPKGLRVSIPDDGFTLFAFHGNLNTEMDGLEAGQWARDIVTPKNGRWTFRDRNAKLKLGDKIYFWTYVIKDGLGYRQDDGVWTVTEFVNEDGTVVDALLPEFNNPGHGPNKIPPGLANKFPPGQNKIPPGQANKFPPGQANKIPPGQANKIPPGQANKYPPQPTQTSNQPNTNVPVVTDTPTKTCVDSLTKVMGQQTVCKGDLIFDEEFNDNDIKELRNWEAEEKFPLEPDYPFNLYAKDGTLSLREGSLKITPVLTETKYGEGVIYEELDLTNTCTGHIGTAECDHKASGPDLVSPVVTGRVNTKNSFSFKFGRVEVRAKLPAGSWLVPEINLEPRDRVYGSSRYASGLIRIAYAKGNADGAKYLYGGPVLSDTEPYRSFLMQKKLGLDNWNKDFHNYTLVWMPDSLQLYVDGNNYGTINPGEGFYQSAREHAVPHAAQWLRGTVMAPLDEMFYLSLGLRVGGINDFPDGPDKPWVNKNVKALSKFVSAKNSWYPTWYNPEMMVDYVRVYALNGSKNTWNGYSKSRWIDRFELCLRHFVAMNSNKQSIAILLVQAFRCREVVACHVYVNLINQSEMVALFIFTVYYCVIQGASYEVPKAKIEAIYPKGLKVSLPDDGYSLFAFHGKLNEEMDGLEAGDWSRDIIKAKHGRWTFTDKNAKLKIGDKIYYWTYVIKNGLGYREDDGEFTVTGYVDKAGNPIAPINIDVPSQAAIKSDTSPHCPTITSSYVTKPASLDVTTNLPNILKPIPPELLPTAASPIAPPINVPPNCVLVCHPPGTIFEPTKPKIEEFQPEPSKNVQIDLIVQHGEHPIKGPPPNPLRLPGIQSTHQQLSKDTKKVPQRNLSKNEHLPVSEPSKNYILVKGPPPNPLRIPSIQSTDQKLDTDDTKKVPQPNLSNYEPLHAPDPSKNVQIDLIIQRPLKGPPPNPLRIQNLSIQLTDQQLFKDDTKIVPQPYLSKNEPSPVPEPSKNVQIDMIVQHPVKGPPPNPLRIPSIHSTDQQLFEDDTKKVPQPNLSKNEPSGVQTNAANTQKPHTTYIEENEMKNVTCDPSISKTSTSDIICKGQLIFDEEFSTNYKDNNKWTPEIKFPSEPENAFNVYLDEGNIQMDDGKLLIKPTTLESKYGLGFLTHSLDLNAMCTGKINTSECIRSASGPQILPPTITGKITTKNSFSFRYGRIEIRAKMPLGTWLVPELQLESRDNVYGSENYQSGLMRVGCVRGNLNLSKYLYGGPILYPSYPLRSRYLKVTQGFDHFSKTFHNYTLVWTPDKISMYVDGENYGEVQPDGSFYEDASKFNVTLPTKWREGTKMAPFDEMFYISLGLSVGGHREYPESVSKPWSNASSRAMFDFWITNPLWLNTWYQETSSLQVDYVRVYAL